MNVENFSNLVQRSSIINIYVATAFFATLIYFVINANLYTPLEMIIGVMLSTIAFKGIGNLMFSLIILFFKSNNEQDLKTFDEISTKINGLLGDLSLQEAKLKSTVINE